MGNLSADLEQTTAYATQPVPMGIELTDKNCQAEGVTAARRAVASVRDLDAWVLVFLEGTQRLATDEDLRRETAQN